MGDEQGQALFWKGAPNRRYDVAMALSEVMETLGVKASVIVSRAKLEGTTLDYKVIDRLNKWGCTIRDSRIRQVEIELGPKACTLKDPNAFTGLASALVNIMGDVDRDGNLSETRDELIELIRAARAAETAQQPSPQPRADAAGGLDGRMLVALLCQLTGLSLEQVGSATKAFFTRKDLENNAPYSHYLCYRFHSNSSQIVKSFMVFKAPTNDFPACLFAHFYPEVADSAEAPDGSAALDVSDTRETRGIVMPGREFVYCLGAMQQQEALKVLAIERPRGFGAPSSSGLVMSMDKGPVVARVFLKKTTFTHHSQAGIGVFTDEQLKRELGADLKRLRNTIGFTLDKSAPIFFGGQPIDQEAMVEEVRRRLVDSNGNSLFTYGDGRPFNPASDNHYTFNAALGVWGSGR